MIDPMDIAAMTLLRAVLADLDAGITYCPALVAEEDQQGGFRLAVTVRARPVEEGEGDTPPGDDVPVFTVGPGLPCPRCGEALHDASGTLMCGRCGPLGQLPGV